MYTFKYPINFSKAFEILAPGETKSQIYNLAEMNWNAGDVCSIHAVSSEPTLIEFFMSNISLDEDSPNWLDCQSIPNFTIQPTMNHFVQQEFIDVCSFLLIRVTALDTNKDDTAIKMNFCFKGKPKNRKPRPKPHPDEFELVQGGTLVISNNDLLTNDEYEIIIKDLKVDNAINGVLTKEGTKITYRHTGRYGEPASFTYQLIDEDDRLSFPCLVNIKIKMLPEIKGYIFPFEDLDDFINNYVPPTFADIFKSWSRFYYSYYYPSGTTPVGEAAAWQMVAEDQFLCTVNSAYTTGFVSPEKFDYYEHQVDLSSTNSDDDEIHVIIAYARIGNSNYSLQLNRESGGMNSHTNTTGFSIQLVVDNTYTTIKPADGKKCWSKSPSANASGYGWNSTSPTRVKVIRDGDKITCLSSPFESLDLSLGEKIIIDLNDYPSLDWAKGKHSYGYSCYSQNQSTYADVTFSGAGEVNASTLYSLDDGSVYSYQDGKWVIKDEKIWDTLGYPRIIENVVNQKRYLIEYGKITELD